MTKKCQIVLSLEGAFILCTLSIPISLYMKYVA